MLDVSHRSIATASGNTHECFLQFWNGEYSNLTGVAWGGLSASAFSSEFTFMPVAGQHVTLISFDFGDFQNRNVGSSARILDAATQNVPWTSGTFDPGATAMSFAPSVSSASGLILRWGPDSDNVGIANILLSVTAVPEPGTWALMLGGAALPVLRRHRAA